MYAKHSCTCGDQSNIHIMVTAEVQGYKKISLRYRGTKRYYRQKRKVTEYQGTSFLIYGVNRPFMRLMTPFSLLLSC